MNYLKKSVLLLTLLLTTAICKAQSFKFGFVSDTHIGNSTSAEDLRRTVKDINADTSLKFVVITGDITEFGADSELHLAKQILDSLNKKWYIIPGNHDANWSESGANSFLKVFGSETFSFTYGGYLFAATSSGPSMRMSPGQVPHEQIVWLDSVLTHMKKPDMPLVYLNHYPQDSSQNNWYEAINLIKKRNVQLVLVGHGHANHHYSFEGIPGVMGRSNLRAKDSIGGYTIVTFNNGTASFEERTPVKGVNRKWYDVQLYDHHFNSDTTHYARPSYAVNNRFPQIRTVWSYQDQSDIGAGTTVDKNLIIGTDTKGIIFAINKNTGKSKWSYHTGGKMYSTAAVVNGHVVAGSSDGYIYCIAASNGKLIWKAAALKAVLGSPVITNNTVYIGASDGHFRAIDLSTGKIKWDFDQVTGFVVTKPLIYNGKVYFGCWNNDFYALDLNTGKQVWKWSNGSTNRMFSPAACYPVATNGRVFIVAPDNYMTSFNANNGSVIWRKKVKSIRARESMGLSSDGSMVYVKTMDGQLDGISTSADTMQLSWQAHLRLPYDISPTAIVENNGIVFVPTHSGLACAVDRKSGEVLWLHKTSNSLVNSIMPLDKKRVIVNTMDGKLICLEYAPGSVEKSIK